MGEPWSEGEDALIATTFAPLASGFSGALGLTDDCAFLTPPEGSDLVLTTDAVAAGVHFFADDAAQDIAWKALAVNASDLAAKGARPLCYLLSLSFPEPPTQAWLGGFAAGLAEAQAAFAMALAGGDTDRRPGPFSATVTAIGAVPKGRMVRRAGARDGDVLFVSGAIGDAALGLRLRSNPEEAEALGLDKTAARALVARYLRPQPRLALAPHLLAFASAAMDVSDGLVKDCRRLARASGLAATLDGARVPFSDAVEAAMEARPGLFEVAITGGDDYEVLAAVPRERAEAFQRAAAESGVAVAEIGQLAEGVGVTVLGRDGQPLDVGKEGWDHFP